MLPAALRRTGQAVKEAKPGQGEGLEGLLGRDAAEYAGHAVRRAAGRAEALHEGGKPFLEEAVVEEGGRFHGKARAVGRAAALGREDQAVGSSGHGPDIRVDGQVVARIGLGEEGCGSEDRGPEPARRIGAAGSPREGFLVGDAAGGPDGVAPPAMDIGRARVLAEGKDALGRHSGVADQGEGHEAFGLRGGSVRRDGGEALELRDGKAEGDLLEGLAGQGLEGGRLDQEGSATVAGLARDRRRGQVELPVKGRLAEVQEFVQGFPRFHGDMTIARGRAGR